MNNKNKGFALFELLGVIIIIILIILLVILGTTNFSKNRIRTNIISVDSIFDAANVYIMKHPSYYPEEDGNKYYISLAELVSDDLLKSPVRINYADIDLTNLKCVQLTYDNGFKYQLEDNENCVYYNIKEEVEKLGCMGTSCKRDPKWVYSTNYWSESTQNYAIYRIDTSKENIINY